ncbi:PHP domain-containing protein [Halosegnis marinus]|uniref:histidinol-phosphatase n=2 Tax=Halosegnis marinus TaxID=3034023 RepID=A0ABD5ZMN9_9EURY|nr:PHP domain-containing protein [Halosegnis sp. DT85]
MNRDYHVHSNYSDGTFLPWMVSAAAEAGLDAVGIADHCTVTDRDGPKRHRRAFGFALDITYERRRRAIREARERHDIAVYDAAEMDYHPADEGAIAEFLDGAGFDYALGSVHELDGTNVHTEPHFADQPEADLRGHVDTYFDRLVALAESELFEIAAHVDLVERNRHLRGFATEDHYRRAAEAFADSRTVPELNAGRALSEYGEVHPTPAFMEVLREAGVEFVFGTDSHRPGEIADRKEELEKFAVSHGVETTALGENGG